MSLQTTGDAFKVQTHPVILMNKDGKSFDYNIQFDVNDKNNRITICESEKLSWRKWSSVPPFKWYRPTSWDITDISLHGNNFHDHWRIMYVDKKIWDDWSKEYKSIVSKNGGSMAIALKMQACLDLMRFPVWDERDIDRIIILKELEYIPKQSLPHDLRKDIYENCHIMMRVFRERIVLESVGDISVKGVEGYSFVLENVSVAPDRPDEKDLADMFVYLKTMDDKFKRLVRDHNYIVVNYSRLAHIELERFHIQKPESLSSRQEFILGATDGKSSYHMDCIINMPNDDPNAYTGILIVPHMKPNQPLESMTGLAWAWCWDEWNPRDPKDRLVLDTPEKAYQLIREILSEESPDIVWTFYPHSKLDDTDSQSGSTWRDLEIWVDKIPPKPQTSLEGLILRNDDIPLDLKKWGDIYSQNFMDMPKLSTFESHKMTRDSVLIMSLKPSPQKKIVSQIFCVFRPCKFARPTQEVKLKRYSSLSAPFKGEYTVRQKDLNVVPLCFRTYAHNFLSDNVAIRLKAWGSNVDAFETISKKSEEKSEKALQETLRQSQ